jgi:hypothetical protein
MSPLIDAPRQSNFRLRASFFAAIITTAATPDSHPDCRALLIKIVALQVDPLGRGTTRFLTRRSAFWPPLRQTPGHRAKCRIGALQVG